MSGKHLELAKKLAARFAELPQVEAVSLTGSQMMGVADDSSDIDLYIYQTAEIPVSERMELAAPYADGAEFNLNYWGTEDTWYDLATGIRVEAIFWSVASIESNMEHVLARHEAKQGYTTAVLHSVRNGRILFDRNSWLHLLQVEVQGHYPDELRRAIIAENYPIMRKTTSSYVQQLDVAAKRGDLVSLNHRTTMLLASYFDILFAINGVMNPGEKRLVYFAETFCEQRPPALREQVEALITCACGGDPVAAANALVDGLDATMRAAGINLEQI